MCGIVGIIPKSTAGFTSVQSKMFNQMLYADVLRGRDATGVIGVMKDGDFAIQKEASDAYIYDFDGSKLDKETYMYGAALIGHNRALTIGANSDENAHPFVVDDTFAMVHNGTLRNHKDFADTKVDSEALAIAIKKAMDEEDYTKALEDTLSKVDGAYACVWYDQKRDEIGMVRNSERPMYILETVTSILFGSEKLMVEWIATRNNETIKQGRELPVDTLVQFNMKKGKGAVKESFLSIKLPPKKGYQNGTTPTSTIPTGTGLKKPASKNAFKAMRTRLLGKALTFTCLDYVVTVPGNFYIMGESEDGAHDLLEVNHRIDGFISTHESGVHETDFYNPSLYLSGVVKEVLYEKETKCIHIAMEQLMVESIASEAPHDYPFVH